MRVQTADLIGLQEMAGLLGVAKETTWRWRSRRVLPAPVAVVSGTPVYTIGQIEKWARQTGRLKDPEVPADAEAPTG